MRLLIYGINYHPELTGIGKYTTELAEWLAKRGHQVEVITAMPYYPEWKVHKAYRQRGWHREIINGVTVHRVPIYVPQRVTGARRLLHDLSFMFSSLVPWLLMARRRFDTVLCIYPPLVSGFIPLLYGWLTRTPYMFHVQDLQVDAARKLGLIRNPWLLKILEGCERLFLKRAQRVITISEGMARRILLKGLPAHKLAVLPNWVDTELLKPYQPPARVLLKQAYGYAPEHKVVLYSGNLGEKQGLDMLLKAAHQLRHLPALHFLIVGDGAAKPRLAQLCAQLALERVRFAPLVPKAELPDLLNMADLHIVLQSRGASDLVMPSKLGGILACGGVPLIAAESGSDLARLVQDHGFGLWVEAEQEPALVACLRDFLRQPHLDTMAQKALQYTQTYLSADQVLSQFEKTLDFKALTLNPDQPVPLSASA